MVVLCYSCCGVVVWIGVAVDDVVVRVLILFCYNGILLSWCCCVCCCCRRWYWNFGVVVTLSVLLYHRLDCC